MSEKELIPAGGTSHDIQTLFSSSDRDFLLQNSGDQVAVTELEGKTIGLYFSLFSYKLSVDFTEKLVEFYSKLKGQGEKFEIVMVPLDTDEEGESVKKGFKNMPWVTLPVKDKTCKKLIRYFELSTLPTLVIIGPDGKTLHSNVAEIIEEHGSIAYPFTPEHFSELEMIEKAKREAQTLESILVNGDLNFVVAKDGVKIPVSDLVGKRVLLYFSAHWCPPCRAFTPKLIEAYNTIKTKDDAFEVIFISSDRDEASFEEYFSTMPWLALPFGDKRKESLSRVFKIRGIPMLAALGPTGRTVTTNARELIMVHGAEAYPFTEERVKEIEAEYEEMAKGWPKKVKHELHEDHELELIRSKSYICDGCGEQGHVWSFKCAECDFDLHPKCALGEDKDLKEDGNPKEGWVCDGDVCHKA